MQRLILGLLLAIVPLACLAVADDDRLPVVPDGFAVDVVATEPLVRNPCVMAFDRLGRIFVGQGPQWRKPTPDSPGDRVDILVDDNADGIADRVKTFADGFNCIQGLAWNGRDLWVANAPDLTIVRDLDGDDQADEYVRVYTGLGNLEHALHGLNFGPDGKLYMSKGNSKGYNRLDQLAPKAFRELWDIPSPDGAPDYTPIEVVAKNEYRKRYHTPSDDWGRQGGILRCDPNGRNLEVVSRGFRNPWDICFDDSFEWLGTDNDQTQGDKIVAPFPGAQFGWGHAWSYNWSGIGHLPTVPASTPLFEGSGTGVIHYHAQQFPPEYRNVFFVNDWIHRQIYLFRPQWDGALMKCSGGFPETFAQADGGRSMPSSSGRMFEPTDIEVGPDGAIYVLSWGHAYGATIANGKQVDAGRVYRIRSTANRLTAWASDHRSKPMMEWSLDELFKDLGSHVPVWRTDAQNEFVRRGDDVMTFLFDKLADTQRNTAETTWLLWTLGRLSSNDSSIDDSLVALARDSDSEETTIIQALRVLAFRNRNVETSARLPAIASELLAASAPRVRHAAVQAIWQAKQSKSVPDLLDLAADEPDRVTFYSTWNALRQLGSMDQRKLWLEDRRAGVRLASLLGLFEDNAIAIDQATRLQSDTDDRISGLVDLWFENTGGDDPVVEMSPPPGEYSERVSVSLKTSIPNGVMTYTLDGSAAVKTSTKYKGVISIDQTSMLRVAVEQDNTQAGRITSGEYRIRNIEPYEHRKFITDLKARSDRPYIIDWTGLAIGKKHYTDRQYQFTDIPAELSGLPYVRTSNDDDLSNGADFIRMNSDSAVTLLVGVDTRSSDSLTWMNVGQKNGFAKTDLELATTDAVFRIFRKEFPAGQIILGGNTNDAETDAGRGNYIVVFDRTVLTPLSSNIAVTKDDVRRLLKTADPENGRELFLHPKGAGCVKCHAMEGHGSKYAPDLSDIGSRTKDVDVLIDSILRPSAVITEGFAQQKILTIDGKVILGAVIEETGRSIKVVDTNGEATTIQKSNIQKRAGSDLSPMPSGFDKLMSARQVADVVAWLMTQKVFGDRSGFSLRDRPNRTDIFYRDQRIAQYIKEHPVLTRRGLVNITTFAGTPVTRKFPAAVSEDHPMMHPGIWLGFGDLDGNDYWRLNAPVDFAGFVQPLVATKDHCGFTARNRFLDRDGGRTVCDEMTRYEFQRVPQGLLLRIDAEYKSDEHDFYFGDQEESGLGVRVTPSIRVRGGDGTIVNDRGERNEDEIWGKQAKWFDYFGNVGGRQIGIMVVPSPRNTRPSWLHARDYGVVVTNPFPKQPKERREPYVKTWVKRGETFRLSYAVLVHDLATGEPLDQQAAYRMALEALQK